MKILTHLLWTFTLSICFVYTGCSPTIQQGPNPAFQAVRSVRVTINQDCEGLKSPILKKEDIDDWLKIVGLYSVPEGAQEYDGEMIIKVHGKALSSKYQPLLSGIGGLNYSGAQVKGSITFRSPRTSKQIKFSGIKQPPFSIPQRYARPQDAPFKDAFFEPSSFPKKMAQLMVLCYGADILSEAMRHQSWHVRRGAAEVLATTGDTSTTELLITALKDEDVGVREASVNALGKIRDERAVEPLIGALVDNSIDVRLAAIDALARIKDSRSIEPLIASLKPWDSPINKTIEDALRRITQKNLGQDPARWKAWWQEKQGLKAKEGHPDFKSTRKVKIAIDQQYEGQRRNILKEEQVADWFRLAGVEVVSDGVQSFDGEIAIEIKGSAMSERYSSIPALQGGGGTRHYSGAYVNGMIKFTCPSSRKYALFSGSESPPSFMQSKSYHTPQDAPFEEALIAPHSFPGQMALLISRCYGHDVLYNALKHESLEIRRGTAYALSEIGDADAILPLTAGLMDKDREVRRYSAIALGKIGDTRAVEMLIISLKDENPPVRAAVAKALGAIGDHRAVEPLIAALDEQKDSNTSIQRARSYEFWIALKNITGQDFGRDRDKLKAWWEQNKVKFQSDR